MRTAEGVTFETRRVLDKKNMHKIFDTANGATKGVRDIIMEFGEKIEINTSKKTADYY